MSFFQFMNWLCFPLYQVLELFKCQDLIRVSLLLVCGVLSLDDIFTTTANFKVSELNIYWLIL